MKSESQRGLFSRAIAMLLMLAGSASGGDLLRRQFLFDMGTSNSPLESGWTRVTHQTVYTVESGFGWETAAAASFDDPVPVPEAFRPTHPHWAGPVRNTVLRDGVEDERPMVFKADVPPGRYWVSALVGRYTQSRHDMDVSLQGRAMATNIDAWGPVWGSHGGTPTRVVSGVVDVPEGRMRWEFKCAVPTPDRWREYVSKRPEDGRLWFLGPNRNSVLGLRMHPFVGPRLRLEPTGSADGRHDRMVGRLRSAPLQAVVDDFNAGAVARAMERARSFRPVSQEERIDLGSALDALAGSMSVEDRAEELRLVSAAETVWRTVLEVSSGPDAPRDEIHWLALWRLESAMRHRMALEYVGMMAYSWAFRKTGLRSYDRYWSAYDLEGGLTPEDPLHWKGRLLRGRVAHWCWAEGDHRNTAALADDEFQRLQTVYPHHPIVRLYRGDRVTSRLDYRCPWSSAPAWARLQHEALARYLDLIHFWVEKRQADNGELGGGWGDDVEILRGWLPAVLALDDPIARRGLRSLAEGVWNSGEMTHGYSREISDVEHGAELMSDTHPLMALVDYGNPVYLERCLATMAAMRDVWTAPVAPGRRLFKAHHYSATEISPRVEHGADVALNGRAANPGLLPLWYARHPGVQRLLGEWVASWNDAAFRIDDGKPAGFVPGSIRFRDGRLGGFAERWWQTKGYFSDFESVDYTSTLYNHMLALFAATGDPDWMRCLRATTAAVIRQQAQPENSTTAGTAAWSAQVSDAESVAEVMSKWRLITGNPESDPFLARRGSAYQRFLLTGDLHLLEKELKRIIEALSVNIEMSTSEVLFTDRVALPGNEVLFEMMTGSLGVATYWPLHAVTWERTDADVAVLVEHASTDRLEARLYSFAGGSKAIHGRLWRLEPGTYEVLRSPEGTVGRPRASMWELLERGQSLPLELPPRQVVVLSIRRIRAAEKQAAHLPDPALGPDAIEVLGAPVVGRECRVRTRLHNVGSASAKRVRARLLDGARLVSRIDWTDVEAPIDLRPVVRTVDVPWRPGVAGRCELVLELEPGPGPDEITRSNNRRTLGVTVSAATRPEASRSAPTP